MNPSSPITEADLHAWVDGQLAAERAREVEAYLATRPDEVHRVKAWRAQKQALRALFDPVQDEPLPARLVRSARPRLPWYAQRMAAGIAIALLGGAAGWGLRGGTLDASMPAALGQGTTSAAMQAFAQRAAVAHAVYSPDQRRPVEVDAAHEDQLVAWLSKRMGSAMKPPHLQALGYALEGGRLLPGGKGPVAQFMYRDGNGSRLTLYVSNEIGQSAQPNTRGTGANTDTAFRFAREGAVNVFYWVDGPFGYALSAQADRAELARVSAEVYRQLAAGVDR
jgi:anti-sigma factor RsiW